MQYLFNHPLTHVVFWTLIHSLWQGIVIAIIAVAVLYQTKKSKPVLRYNFFCGLMIVFIAANVCTFIYESNLFYQKISIATYDKNVLPSTNTINITETQNIEDRLMHLFQSFDYLIVSVYLLIVLLKCFNIIVGFRNIYRVKHRQVFCVNEFWNERLYELVQKIHLSKPVQLLQSAIIKVPATIGFFKPVILFPASLLSELPVQEIEAILLHELAHIKRKDYLINIIQNFTEIIFFFNPAVLWLSSLIKDERENCCDDIAIHHTNNKKQFIHALVSFQEQQLSLHHAPAFAGKKSQLFNRVKRIITNNNKTLNNMEKILLVSGIIITGFIAATVPQNLQPHFIQQNQTAKSSIANFNKKDTVPVVQQDSVKDSAAYDILLKEQKQAGKDQAKLMTEQTKEIQAQAEKLAMLAEKLSKADQVKIQKEAMKMQKAVMSKQGKEIQAKAEELAKQAEATSKIDQEKYKKINSKEMQELIDKATALNTDAVKQLKDLNNSQELKALVEQSQTLSINKELMEMQITKREDALKMQEDALKDKMDLLKENQDMLNNPNGKLMTQDMMHQIEDLKRKQQELLNQNKALRDSINQ